MAEGGILYLEQVGALSMEAQFRLERLLTQGIIFRGRDSRPFPARLRVIASETRSPVELLDSGMIHPGFFYALNALTIRIPSLRERKDDILPLAYYFLQQSQNRFSRFIRLTSSAERWIQMQEWPYNLPELASCCRRLVLTTPKRIVDEVFIQESMEGEPLFSAPNQEEKIILKDPRAEELEQILKKCGGNRTLAAQMLHINPSTLWRRMKKLGVKY